MKDNRVRRRHQLQFCRYDSSVIKKFPVNFQVVAGSEDLQTGRLTCSFNDGSRLCFDQHSRKTCHRKRAGLKSDRFDVGFDLNVFLETHALSVQRSLCQRSMNKDMRAEDKPFYSTVFEDRSGRHEYRMIIDHKCSWPSHLRDKALEFRFRTVIGLQA